MVHAMSMYSNIEHYKDGVMRDEELSDMQKLQMVFCASKENLKERDPQLYYAILGVIDHAKRGAKQTEMSYIDLLYQLKSDVESDNIPKVEKGNIVEIIEELESILWKYSY